PRATWAPSRRGLDDEAMRRVGSLPIPGDPGVRKACSGLPGRSKDARRTLAHDFADPRDNLAGCALITMRLAPTRGGPTRGGGARRLPGPASLSSPLGRCPGDRLAGDPRFRPLARPSRTRVGRGPPALTTLPGRRAHAEPLVEAVGEVGHAAEADRVGDLAGPAFAFGQQVGCAFEPVLENQLHGCPLRQLAHLLEEQRTPHAHRLGQPPALEIPVPPAPPHPLPP